MKTNKVLIRIFVLFSTLCSTQLSAHLMVDQNGTLNFVEDKAYMVLSVPITAFKNLDTDGNQSISMQEFNLQRQAIVDTIRSHVRLTSKGKAATLDGIRLLPSLEHHDEIQLVIMGVFDLDGHTSEAQFSMELFNLDSHHSDFTITVKRKSDNFVREIIYTAQNSTNELFIQS